MSHDDLPWLRRIFALRYANYDAEHTEAWFSTAVLQNPLAYYAVRTDDAFLIALLRPLPWLPNDFEAHIIVVCADIGKIWQVMPLLRASIDWARHRKAVAWHFQSDTMFDVAPLVRRLGAASLEPRFIIRLEGSP
jgi:hypothetical protein